MIDKQTAVSLAQSELKRLGYGDDVVLSEGGVIEREFGWVFFYNTRAYLETRAPEHRLIGNAPLIIDRRDGGIHHTGTARPTEWYIHEYERKRGPEPKDA